jgi:hypothetical protein
LIQNNTSALLQYNAISGFDLGKVKTTFSIRRT